MLRRLGRSCFGLSILFLLCSITLVFVGSVIFSQSQVGHTLPTRTAISPSVVATRPISQPTPLPVVISPVSPDIAVTLEMPVAPPTVVSVTTDDPLILTPGAPTSNNAIVTDTTAALPRNSGTASYPMTLTLEAALSGTRVAGYQAGVNATRTAIQVESEVIYPTLTALAASAGN